jgi:hypothetical protein
MRYFSVIIFVAFISAVSFAQVDTLQLVEIGSIQAPSEITELYVEDLDGDSLKEIIICTDYYVYIYDGQTYQVEWTSPPLIAPTDLLFEDINGNGLIDLSVKDSTNIHLFDPHTPQTIWTSPALDSTYKCYTIGDRNEDGWIDVAVVSKELLTRFNNFENRDTVWIDSYDGPLFYLNEVGIVTMNNYYDIYGWYWAYRYEFPVNIIIGRLDGIDGRRLRYILFSYEEIRTHTHLYDFYSDGGEVFIQDCENDTSFIELFSGLILYSEIININDMYILYSIGKYNSGEEGPLEGSVDIRNFSADSTTSINQIWDLPALDYYGWRGLLRYDIDSSYFNEEIIYGSNDSIHCLSYDGQQILWETGGLTEPFEVITAFKNGSLFAFPQVVCAIDSPVLHYALYDGGDGSLSAIMPFFGGEVSGISDLDDDGIDAILSIQDSELKIYLDETATGIADDALESPILFQIFNYPNPFNSSTTIEYTLPQAGRVRIDIYDLLGRKVETLVNEEVQAGRHRAVWDASPYSSGVYFYRVEAGDFVDTKRMVYLK